MAGIGNALNINQMGYQKFNNTTGVFTANTIIPSQDGGTGVNNGASTITLGGSLTTSGAFASTFTMTNTTSVTFPTSGTLATTSQIPSTPISLANGGTNASLTASNGGVFYSTSTAGAILSGTATAGQHLQSGASSAPSWTTATFPATATGTGTILRADGTNWVATTSTYPNTNAASTLLYASSANVMAALATANNSALVTDGSGVPSLGTSLSNDFTYTSSTAGATRTLTVSNTNNSNTASQALIQTTTGGASAGDPFHTFTITGATSFSMGLDNSASDAFVISASTALGTTNVMSVQPTGEITYPLQTAFLAYLATTVANVTGDGTVYTVIYDTEVFDQNSDFNLGTSTFTAPVTGKYNLSVVARLGGGTLINPGIVNIVTSNHTYTMLMPVNATNTNSMLSSSILLDMDINDTATITLQSTDTGGKIDDVIGESGTGSNVFSGYLVC